MINNKEEYIVCAGVHFINDDEYIHQPKNIKTGFVIAGHRHHNCFMTAGIFNLDRKDYNISQGFITSNNRFVDRKFARKIANKAGQVKVLTNADGIIKELFSEDLY